MAILLSVSFLTEAGFLACRIRTTITQTNTTTLNVKTTIIGARKAPQKAPGWDRKQLNVFVIKFNKKHD